VLHQRDLALVPVLHPAPAPVAAGLLAGDDALLQQGDRMALPREEIRGRHAGDAGADHDRIGAFRQAGIALHRVQGA
jgi:hypothetical protein